MKTYILQFHKISSTTIVNLKENDKEMLQIVKENEEEVYKMYDETVEQEKD